MRPHDELVIVVKVGGAEGVGTGPLVADLAGLVREGRRCVIVHGGSAATDRLAAALGVPNETVTSPSGHTSRRTDRPMVEVFAQATALQNRLLVERLQGAGVDAFGLSGLDGRVLPARRKDSVRILENGRQRVLRDQWTGTPVSVRVPLIAALLDQGLVPVIAPLAAGEGGEMLNVDGDRAAAVVAAGLGAPVLVILSNVPGVLRRFPDPGSLIRHVPVQEIASLAAVAEGRMRKKVLGAEEALRGGVHSVVIGDARRPGPLRAALAGEGTVIGALPLPAQRTVTASGMEAAT